jgi:hypothetical protein
VYVHVWQHGGGRPVAWHDLSAQLGPLRFPRATFRVFLHREKLVRYLDAVMPGDAPAPPPIDFGRRKAVLIAAGPRSSTGYDLLVDHVAEERSRIVVFVRERTPSLTTRVAGRVTYPYRLITIPRISKPTALTFIGR